MWARRLRMNLPVVKRLAILFILRRRSQAGHQRFVSLRGRRNRSSEPLQRQHLLTTPKRKGLRSRVPAPSHALEATYTTKPPPKTE